MKDFCLEAVMKNFPEADVAEVDAMVTHLKEQRAKFTDRVAWQEYLKNYIGDKKDKISVEMAEKLSTHQAYLDNVDYITKYGDVKQALLSMVEEVSDSKQGAGLSIPRLREAKYKIYNNGFVSALNSSGLLDAFRSGEFDVPIIEYLTKGDLPTNQLEATMVKDMGDLLSHFYDTMLLDLNEAGFNIPKRAGYFGKIVHDGVKIKGNFDNWVKSFVENFDIEKSINVQNKADLEQLLNTTEDFASLKENEFIKELMEDYTKITRDNIFAEDAGEALLSFHGRVDSAARTRAKGRSYVPKSGQSLKNYLKEFGQSSTLADMYGSYASRTAKDISLLKHFGPNYNNGIEMLKNYLKQTLSKEEFDGAWKAFQTSLDRSTGNTLAIPTTGPYKHFATIRKTTTLAYIGKSGVTQLMDAAPSMVHYHSATGKPFPIAAAEILKDYITSVPDAMRKNVAEEMYLYTQDLLSSVNQELMEISQGKAGMLSKTAEAVFTLSGAKFMNKVSYITNAKAYLRRLNQLAEGASMHSVEAGHFSKFNITPEDISHVMPILKAEGMNMGVFHKLPEELFENNRLGLSGAKYKSLMNERFTSYLVERIQKGSPVAGNREKRLLYGDTVEGTLMGEGLRALSQFKMTSAKILLDTAVGLAKEQGGYKKASTYYMLGKWLATTTALGIGVLAIKDYLNQPIDDVLEGKMPDHWGDELASKEILGRAMLVGGGALILGDLMYNASDPTKVWQAFQTPAISTSLDAITLPVAIGMDYYEKGEIDNKTEKEIGNAVRSVIPLQNWFFVTPLIEGYKAGQIDLLE